MQIIDARYLEPPEPFVAAMDAVDALAPGESFELLLFREPFPLYDVLDRYAFARKTELRDDGTYSIIITRPAP
jgi:TusA-related sulfurtransferase